MWQWFIVALVVAFVGMHLMGRGGCCGHSPRPLGGNKAPDSSKNVVTAGNGEARVHDHAPLCH
jgi:hypothetical protein